LTSGYYNFALGTQSGMAITEGYSNVFIGHESGNKTTTGSVNTCVGTGSLKENTTGSSNMAIGSKALYYGRTNANNVAIGRDCFYGEGRGTGGCSNNVGLGRNTGYYVTTGSNNIFLGYKAGYRQTTNSNLLIIDNQQRADVATEATDAIIYGVKAATPASQTLAINAAASITGLTTATGGISLPANANIALATTTGTKIGTGTDQLLGFYNATPVSQRLKANYNNWAALSDVVNALVALGLFDAA